MASDWFTKLVGFEEEGYAATPPVSFTEQR